MTNNTYVVYVPEHFDATDHNQYVLRYPLPKKRIFDVCDGMPLISSNRKMRGEAGRNTARPHEPRVAGSNPAQQPYGTTNAGRLFNVPKLCAEYHPFWHLPAVEMPVRERGGAWPNADPLKR